MRILRTPSTLVFVLALALAPGGSAVVGDAQAASAKPPSDAVSAARFSLTLDGVEIASFTELERLTAHAAAPTPGAPAPATTEPHTLVLRRVLGRDLTMSTWLEAAAVGDPRARRSVSLTAFAADGRQVLRYFLSHAWPSKIEIGPMKAGSAELLETVTITCEQIQRVAI
jgi:phage tail-like protein